jgi:hypothetical protein
MITPNSEGNITARKCYDWDPHTDVLNKSVFESSTGTNHTFDTELMRPGPIGFALGSVAGLWSPIWDNSPNVPKRYRFVRWDTSGDIPAVGGTQDYLALGATLTPIFASWCSGFHPIQQEEIFERVRRINMWSRGGYELRVYKDYEISLNATPTFQQTFTGQGAVGTGGANLSPPMATPPLFRRSRPETRSRSRAVEFRDETLLNNFIIERAEYVIRGGKEH